MRWAEEGLDPVADGSKYDEPTQTHFRREARWRLGSGESHCEKKKGSPCSSHG